jgi:hypothetical protein
MGKVSLETVRKANQKMIDDGKIKKYDKLMENKTVDLLEKVRDEYYAYHATIYSEFSTGKYEDDYVTFLENRIEELGAKINKNE